MQQDLMPKWMQHVADFNPLQWAVVAGRSVMSSDVDWGVVAGRSALLAAFAAICTAFATRAFAIYERPI